MNDCYEKMQDDKFKFTVTNTIENIDLQALKLFWELLSVDMVIIYSPCNYKSQ